MGNCVSTYAVSTYVVSTKVVSTKVVSTKVVSTYVFSTYAVSTYVVSTKVVSTYVVSTYVVSTKVVSTYVAVLGTNYEVTSGAESIVFYTCHKVCCYANLELIGGRSGVGALRCSFTLLYNALRNIVWLHCDCHI
jgi:hypothetical protein